MIRKLALAGLLGLGTLTSCAALVTDAPTLIATGVALLKNYEATPTPSQAVITEANKLLAAAQADVTTYGATSSEALASAAALEAYLATSAPGDGKTPSTVPVTGATS